uniref:Homeobox protein DLX-3-like n=1 Tax=Crassostrea virginica TaxID=6565 RepID=A0A8B8AZ33_CRAVI|nr:homeobox protein DLX-3-like [Crassostrea virginica]
MPESDLCKKAGTKPRTKYSPEQLSLLEGAFGESQYPDTDTLEDLADTLGVCTDKVSVWFQNRRSKFKRQSKDSHVAWMRKQLYDTDMRSSCQHSPPDAKQHVLSPPEQHTVPDNTGSPPNSNLHYMPYARPDTNAFIQGHPRRADSRNPASYQLPFPACYGAMSASSGFWDQMDVHQRSRILNHLMADQMDQHQPFSRPSCQYIDRQSHNAPQFPTSHGIPSLAVPNGFGF